MGGHGALTLYLSSILNGFAPFQSLAFTMIYHLSSRKQYCSTSAFAPIANPSKCPWGEKAFKGYLAGELAEGADKYDATELIKKLGGKESVHILVDYVRGRV
jgi:S-formylglutathione hydrolase